MSAATVPDSSPAEHDDVKEWHFAIGGLHTEHESLSLGGPFVIRRLRLFPSHELLATSLTSLPVAGSMALYGEQVIRHELVINAERFEERTERIFPTAEAILAGLRIRTRAEILCPAVCERSWADLRAAPPNRCRAFHFERGLSHQGRTEPKVLLPEDLEWVKNHLVTVIELTDDERFQTAIEALCTYMLAANDRMKVAQLWAGVEALFDIEHELQFRLSTLVARFLLPPGKACAELFREVRQLYVERSKIVHGKKVSEEKIRVHITAVRGRLADILTRIVERRSVPSREELEDALFEN